jgi:hypothetical protein
VANLNAEQLRRLARLGAMSRLEQIREEESAIRAEFPELFGRDAPRGTESRDGGSGGRGAAKAAAAGAGKRRRRRPAMTTAARKAVADRMRKYWAERRKAKGSK